MPIIVSDYTWRQTERSVSIHIPLHGIPPSRVDLFSTEEYLKVSFEQFFFECYPLEKIDIDASTTIIEPKSVILNLKKQIPATWSALNKELTKPEQMELKERAIEESQAKLTAQQGRDANQQHQLKRDAVNFAISLDTDERNKIAAIKEEEKNNALGMVEEWVCDTLPVREGRSTYVRTFYKKVHPRCAEDEDIPAIPLPRSRSVVEVAFTPRVLPTPSRESQESAETQWLLKQAEARRSAGFVSEDLRPEERCPQYLFDKAAGFLKRKNYLGAISALTFGIEICPKFVDFYILRSRAQFELGNLHKCVEDCSTAMEMLKPEVCANLTQRVECIHRRGLALFKLGLKRQAADELKAAIKLQPSQELTRDLYGILDSPDTVEKDTPDLKLIDH